MANKPCPSPEALSRAFPSSADAALLAHLAGCARCTEAWRQLETLVRLGRELPWSVPGRDQRQELHTRLRIEAERLHGAPRPSRGHRRTWALLMVAAAVACVFIARSLISKPTMAENRRGTISAQGSSSFTHQVTLRDEVVYLTEGTIRIEVQRLQPGERFRVLVGASEVEVKGTVFEVAAERGELRSVHVRSGLVTVRREGLQEFVLATGQSWPKEPPAALVRGTPDAAVAPVLVEPKAAPPEDRPAPSRPRIPSAPRMERTQSVDGSHHRSGNGTGAGTGTAAGTGKDADARQREIDAAFGAGFSALRRKQFTEAAAAFGQAAVGAQKRPIAEDAWYWHAVSLGRAERSEEAIRALRGFLARYPRSARFGEVSCMLGWMLFKAERLDEAAVCFQAVGKESSAEVRESARLGLAAVAARRAKAALRPGSRR